MKSWIDFGGEALKNCLKMLECDYICSNFCYRKNNTKIFDAYKILTLGNIKIGFIGVVTPQTLIKTYLHTIINEDGNLVYDFLNKNNGKEMYDKI